MISAFLTHPIRRSDNPIARDPQRERVYKMEREIIGSSVNHVVKQYHLQVLADHVCRYYKVTKLKIIIVNKPDLKDIGWCQSYSEDDGEPFGHEIYLNRGFHGANASILLHELAHYIVDMTYTDAEEHGAQFVAIYMHLMAKYRIIPSDCFRLLAKRHSVKIAGKFKPGAIRA